MFVLAMAIRCQIQTKYSMKLKYLHTCSTVQLPGLLERIWGIQLISFLFMNLFVQPSGYCCLHHFFLSHWYFVVLCSSFHLSTGGRADFLIGLSNANLMNLAVKLHGVCACANMHTNMEYARTHKRMLTECHKSMCTSSYKWMPRFRYTHSQLGVSCMYV